MVNSFPIRNGEFINSFPIRNGEFINSLALTIGSPEAKAATPCLTGMILDRGCDRIGRPHLTGDNLTIQILSIEILAIENINGAGGDHRKGDQ
jgi:hypothetical protein